MSKYRWLPVLGLAIGLSIVLCVVPVSATNGVIVSVNAPAEIAVGENFTARVEISFVESFAISEFVVTFDSTLLTLTGITDGEINGNTISVDGYTASWEGDPNRVKILVSWPPLFPGVDGSGYICQIHYQVIGSGGQTSSINLSSGLLSNELGEPIEATWVGTSVHIRTTGSSPPAQQTQPTSPSATQEPITVRLNGFMTSTVLTIDRNGRVPEACRLFGPGENIRLDIAQ